LEITFEKIGLYLQILGIIVILIPQIHFFGKLWKKWKNLKKGCLDVAATRWGISDEELAEMTKEEINDKFKKFPLAGWLYDDIKISLFGLSITLFGLFVELWGACA